MTRQKMIGKKVSVWRIKPSPSLERKLSAKEVHDGVYLMKDLSKQMIKCYAILQDIQRWIDGIILKGDKC